jgi:hypothetical protein
MGPPARRYCRSVPGLRRGLTAHGALRRRLSTTQSPGSRSICWQTGSCAQSRPAPEFLFVGQVMQLGSLTLSQSGFHRDRLP